MSAVRRRTRAYQPDQVRDALLAQAEFVRVAAHQLTPEQLARPSGLPGWDVRTLLAHLARQIDALPRLLAEPAPAALRPQTDLNAWAVSTAGIAEDLDAQTREAARAADDQVAAVDAAAEELEAVVETGVREDVLLPHRFGAMRALDFSVTRIVELVTHSDDLTRATGRVVRLDRHALAVTVRALADALAAKAPGSSTELRVPPFVAVQCLPGPRHTRGTPPNVVETDPVTWLRLATGRTTWDAALAAGRLRASGERASALAAELPVLA
ncbi:sterol carrier family protein [Streptomyces sp. DSM 44917]|uniref:Sterol carrier family protein n=1 Tax=Streptomyces boetiae TaxID=3075541 RepID=A0ABU2LBM8_9ACTN|nr:sterol carrier family protein [Streptomyces sp. DSM 44917]MDT0308988.1 sterol carrier family protein [Streptomyces sp. DSM 44917]